MVYIFASFFLSNLMMGFFSKTTLVLYLLSMMTIEAKDVKFVKRYALSRFGDVKHTDTSKPFPYVSPDAPKGGQLKLSTVGTFDTLNMFIAKGTAPNETLEMTYDKLMYRAPDEAFTLYPLLAEYVELAEDNSSIIIHLNPKAKFHDGTALTADDVIASYQHVAQKGRPVFKMNVKKIKDFKKIDNHTLRLDLHPKEDGAFDPELPMILMNFKVMPKAFLDKNDLGTTGMTVVPGSGPYRVASVEIGRFIVLERVKDYWAKDLPSHQGMYNFDTLRVDYYKNQQSQFQAFKSGEFDVYFETNPSQWSKNYNFAAVKEGKVIKFEASHAKPVLIRTIIFNMRREIFQDVNLRKALVYAFDFEGMNRMIYDGAMKSPTSIFANTYLAHQGKAEGIELTLLDSVKESFDGFYQDVIDKGFTLFKNTGEKRKKIQDATTLLKNAGYKIDKGVLCDPKGKPVVLEIMVKDEKLEKVALFYRENLKQIGVALNISRMDSVQYENRVVESDFDMTIHAVANSLSPGFEQLYYYGADYAHKTGSSNYIGVTDKGVMKLIHALCKANTKEDHTTAARALDRYVMNQYWQIPLMYDNVYRVAYWKGRFETPEFDPAVGTSVMAWGWSSLQKAAS